MRMAAIGVGAGALSALLLTHLHSDHTHFTGPIELGDDLHRVEVHAPA